MKKRASLFFKIEILFSENRSILKIGSIPKYFK